MSHTWEFGDWGKANGRIVRYVSTIHEGKDSYKYFVREDGHIYHEPDVTYLPNCTGFDWKEPKPLEIPDGWRELGLDEVVQEGDKFEVCSTFPFWCASTSSQGKTVRNADVKSRFIRKRLQIEEGKWYRTRSGKVVGPAARDSHLVYPWVVPGFAYTNEGQFFANGIPESGQDLIEEAPDPVPKYRPFKNAAEFEPHRDRFVKYKTGGSWRSQVSGYGDDGVKYRNQYSFKEAFDQLLFEDGSAFGVLED